LKAFDIEVTFVVNGLLVCSHFVLPPSENLTKLIYSVYDQVAMQFLSSSLTRDDRNCTARPSVV